MKNLLGRDICLDIDADDESGKEYNVEVQRADKGADRDASTELGKLMHDFYCTNPDDMHYKELADKVRYFKEDEKGVATMCKVMEDMRNENTKQVMVNNIQSIMKNLKLTVEQAMDALSIPQSQRSIYEGLVGKKTQ